MNCRHKKIGTLFIRLLTAAAILFNVIVPSIGNCNCGDCSCCQHSDYSAKLVSPDDKTDDCSSEKSCDKSGIKSSCCNLSSPYSQANVIFVTKNKCCLESDCSIEIADDICPENLCDEQQQHDSESCPCCFKTPPKISRYFLKPSISSQMILKEWKVDLYTSFSMSIYIIKTAAISNPIQSFETPTSRLPLRLHLLFLVLLN
jgi:hypothetical protein